MTLGAITLSPSDARSARRACVGQRRPERKRPSRAAESTSGLNSLSNAGSGSPAVIGDPANGSAILRLPVGRHRAVGVKLKCPVQSWPGAWVLPMRSNPPRRLPCEGESEAQGTVRKTSALPEGEAVGGLRLGTPEGAEAQRRVREGMIGKWSRVRDICRLGLTSGERKRN